MLAAISLSERVDSNRNSYDPLLIATRVHANLMENLPITLLLAGLAELNGADRKKLTSVLALFTLMRVSHVFALYEGNQPARAFGRPVTPTFGRVMLMGARVLRHKHRPAGPGRVARHSYEGVLGLLDRLAPKVRDGITSKCLELFNELRAFQSTAACLVWSRRTLVFYPSFTV